jgi:hypothetical protein
VSRHRGDDGLLVEQVAGVGVEELADEREQRREGLVRAPRAGEGGALDEDREILDVAGEGASGQLGEGAGALVVAALEGDPGEVKIGEARDGLGGEAGAELVDGGLQLDALGPGGASPAAAELAEGLGGGGAARERRGRRRGRRERARAAGCQEAKGGRKGAKSCDNSAA